MSILKDERLRGFRIDIETDSTVQPDPEAEQQAAVQFAEMFGTMLQGAIPLAQQGAVPPDVIGQVLLFVIRRFQVARDLESTIEKWVEALSNGSAQMPPPVDPQVGVAQDKNALERDKMNQAGAQFDKQQAFDGQQADATRQHEVQQQQAQAKGPPFVVGKDGAPQSANDLMMTLQQQQEMEMQQIAQMLAQFMQAQTQQMAQITQLIQGLAQGLSQPKQKMHQIIRANPNDPSSPVVGARTIEQPQAAGPGAPQ